MKIWQKNYLFYLKIYFSSQMEYALNIRNSTQVKSNTCRIYLKKETRQYQKHITGWIL